MFLLILTEIGRMTIPTYDFPQSPILIIGFFYPHIKKLGLGQMPGDIIIKSENWFRHTVLTRRIDPRHPETLISGKMRSYANLIFLIFSYPGNIGSYDPYSVLSWK